ncbi:uncharacterized protein SCHCODRAFT_02643442, partial [Schizophyllum commune H4-8]|uniref:uncharacterized protein n=1 Tax=Schizophyllum commune (strain H4-8 / FGSC 9210) TaxID=578458 RepID=UPI00215F30E0
MADHPHRLLRPRARVYASGGPGVHEKTSSPLTPSSLLRLTWVPPPPGFEKRPPASSRAVGITREKGLEGGGRCP